MPERLSYNALQQRWSAPRQNVCVVQQIALDRPSLNQPGIACLGGRARRVRDGEGRTWPKGAALSSKETRVAV